ncbi:hypothetical protein CASFOL_014489 [Castilleja foliolosa]|uniref:Uncharacterized protein n=1 Tax=Castilleja foliolosa TaxID=1961234 RepID=A0ABD3DS22_9LAMI
MVEALVCRSDWLRGDEFKFYKEPTDEEIEFYKELENIENEAWTEQLLCDQMPPCSDQMLSHSDQMLPPPPVSRPNIPRPRGGRRDGRATNRRGRN